MKELKGFTRRDYKRTWWENFWYPIEWKLKDIWALHWKIPQFIKRVIDYAPLLWTDRDWDHLYLLQMLQFKIKRMREHNEQCSFHMSADSVVQQMKYAEEVLERLIQNDYLVNCLHSVEEKFGEPVMMERPVENGCIEMKFTREKCLEDEALFEEEKDKSRDAFMRADAMEQRDIDRLFRHLNKYYRGWWC